MFSTHCVNLKNHDKLLTLTIGTQITCKQFSTIIQESSIFYLNIIRIPQGLRFTKICPDYNVIINSLSLIYSIFWKQLNEECFCIFSI